jgi:hypothetical protein
MYAIHRKRKAFKIFFLNEALKYNFLIRNKYFPVENPKLCITFKEHWKNNVKSSEIFLKCLL